MARPAWGGGYFSLIFTPFCRQYSSSSWRLSAAPGCPGGVSPAGAGSGAAKKAFSVSARRRTLPMVVRASWISSGGMTCVGPAGGSLAPSMVAKYQNEVAGRTDLRFAHLERPRSLPGDMPSLELYASQQNTIYRLSSCEWNTQA